MKIFQMLIRNSLKNYYLYFRYYFIKFVDHRLSKIDLKQNKPISKSYSVI